MGLFNIFYPNRPGKGVEKDEPQKHAFFQFWTLVGRKLSRLVLLNMMYFVAVSPLLTVIYLYLNDFLGLVPFDPVQAAEVAEMAEEYAVPVLGRFLVFIFGYSIPQPVFIGLVILSAILYGPLTCGFTYMLRNFARQEHAWLSDFWVRAKMNLIPGLKMATLELLFVILFFTSLSATSADAIPQEGSMRITLLICRYATFGIGLIALFMRNYLYVMIVTFNLKIREIVRNAFIFAVLGLPRNFIALLGQAAIALIVVIFVPLMDGLFELLLIFLIALSLIGFIGVFTTYPVIRRFLLDPLEQKTEAAEE